VTWSQVERQGVGPTTVSSSAMTDLHASAISPTDAQVFLNLQFYTDSAHCLGERLDHRMLFR
jgi:hypothetical protein